jgi:outer membrane protein assembly factor BamA
MRILRATFFLLMIMPVFLARAQETVTPDSLPPSSHDDNMQVTVSSIHLSGNKRTRDFIVTREIAVVQGQQLSMAQLKHELVRTHDQLMNTLLFVDVSVYIAAIKGNMVEINVDMKERWYFFPIPYFRLVDRNFNQWWVDQKRSLDRVNYGLKFTQQNTTGRNDELNIWLITGYTKQFTIRYGLPFFDRKLRHGFSVGFSTASTKEINYATRDNKQQFFRQDQTWSRKALRAELTYSYRPDTRNRHYFKVAYNDERIADTVLSINPLYYPGAKTQIRYPDFTYQYRFVNVDYIAYPTRGFLFDAMLYKRGISSDYNLWQANLRAVYAIPVSRRSFLHLEALATAKLPANDYFYNQRLIGYGFYQLRGLEYNVVDGLNGAALKTTFNREVFSFILKNPFKSKTHDRIPIRFFLKAYGDLGYAHARNPGAGNTLNNTLLRTYGVGLDIVSIYDFVFKIEYSFNQLGRDGLYLQTRNNF